MARRATGAVLEREGKRGRTYALRFRAGGERRYVTLGTAEDGWTRARAEEELQNVLADVRRGIWRPPAPVVEAPRPAPSFHEFASEWLEGRRHGLAERTVEFYAWALSNHLLPFFARHRLGAITVEEVDRYRSGKVREGRLSARSINKTIALLAQVLEAAEEYGHLDRNPARGRRRRLKSDSPRRQFLEAEQVAALLEAAGEHRALLATAILAGGLRVSELTALRWRDVNLAAGRLRVVASKTAAGVREVDLAPELLDELKLHRHRASVAAPDDFVFPTRQGTRRDRNAVRNRVLRPAIERANAALAERGRELIPENLTFHSLRHTYASLMAEAGVDAAYTMAQMGHADARLTLSVYTHVGRRREAGNARLGALLAGADWAQTGTSGAGESFDSPEAPTAEGADSA